MKDEEQRKLETLRTDLAQDPQKVIRSLKAQKQRVDTISRQVQSLMMNLSEESIVGLKKLVETHSHAKNAADLASRELFEASPLPKIGSDTWRALWEAARDFSDGAAYPSKQFPEFRTDEDLCVLCQQPLGEDATQRFETFEKFIKSETKAKEQRALTALDDRKKELGATIVSPDSLAAAQSLLNDELSQPEIAEKLNDWMTAANAKLLALLEQKNTQSVNAESPKDLLDKLSQEFCDRIVRAESVLDPESRAKLEGEKQELEDRILLASIREDIQAQIERLKDIARLKSKVKTTARTSITNKNKELSELLVTGALRDRFAREIAKLNLHTIPMELNKARDRKAQSFFRVEFVEYPGQPLGEILSEGEHRCVALAAFLAELVTLAELNWTVLSGLIRPPPHGRIRCPTMRYPSWVTIRKLSVTDSAMASHSRVRVPSGNRKIAPVNRRRSAWNRLCVTWRCMTPPQAPGGVGCGAQGGRKCGRTRHPGRSRKGFGAFA